MTTYRSVHDPDFAAKVEAWAVELGEVLAVLRWPGAAGARSYEFFRSSTAVADRMAALPSRTSVIVFRDRWLPIRGFVTDDLVRRALDAVGDTEYLIASLDHVQQGGIACYPNAAGESRDALAEHLHGWWPGVRVAVGPHPPWWEESDRVLAVYVPDADGTVTPGVY